MDDPYIWLEEISDPRVVAWVDSEDRRARNYVNKYSKTLYPRYLKLNEEPLYYNFKIRDQKYFHMTRSRSFRIGILYRDGEVSTLIDSSTLGRNAVIVNYYVSDRGDLLAYYYSEEGRDLGRLVVVETDTGRVIDTIQGSIHGAVFLDNGRMYYVKLYRSGRCPDGVEAPCDRVFLRESGEDELVFGEGISTSSFIALKRSFDRSRIMVNVSYGWTRSTVYAGDIEDPSSWRMIYGGDHISKPIDYVDGCFIMISYDSRGLGRIICVDQDSGSVKEIVSEGSEYIEDTAVLEDVLAILYIDRECYNKIVFRDIRSGSFIYRYTPEVPSSITLSSDNYPNRSVIAEATTYIQRYRIVEIDKSSLRGNTIIESRRIENVDITHGWVRSHDNVYIHYFMVKRRDRDPDKVILYGYGGFGIALKPTYYIWSIPFIEDGGTLVVANLRGGSEYGEEWHRSGMRFNKINVFKDFIAVARELKRNGSKIVAYGRSNGGLLVGAVLNMDPELFEGAVIGYPVLDMLRFDKLYIGKAWIPEYGDPERHEDREYLKKYSPYHNVRENKHYPPVFLYTGMNDDRVHPSHAFKFHAKLKDYGYRSFLRVERSSGHIGSSPEVVAREMSDVMGFIYKILGLNSEGTSKNP